MTEFPRGKQILRISYSNSRSIGCSRPGACSLKSVILPHINQQAHLRPSEHQPARDDHRPPRSCARAPPSTATSRTISTPARHAAAADNARFISISEVHGGRAAEVTGRYPAQRSDGRIAQNFRSPDIIAHCVCSSQPFVMVEPETGRWSSFSYSSIALPLALRVA